MFKKAAFLLVQAGLLQFVHADTGPVIFPWAQLISQTSGYNMQTGDSLVPAYTLFAPTTFYLDSVSLFLGSDSGGLVSVDLFTGQTFSAVSFSGALGIASINVSPTKEYVFRSDAPLILAPNSQLWFKVTMQNGSGWWASAGIQDLPVFHGASVFNTDGEIGTQGVWTHWSAGSPAIIINIATVAEPTTTGLIWSGVAIVIAAQIATRRSRFGKIC